MDLRRILRTSRLAPAAVLCLGGALLAPAAPAVASPTPAAHGRTCRTLPDLVPLPAGYRPEGITSRGPTLYVSSLADGRIWAADACTGAGRVLLPGHPGRALRGLQVDRRSHLLWAVGQQDATGLVLGVDLRSGRIRHTVTVPGAGFLNDAVLTRSALWVTDSSVDRLTRIPIERDGRPRVDDVSLLPLTGAWPTPDGIRANGIRALPDGRLLLNHSTAGGLWTVEPRTGAVTSVPVSGGPALASGDGLELVGRTLYDVRGASQNGVAVLHLERRRGAWTAQWRGELTAPGRLDVPSTATAALGSLWAVNARFGVADPATASYTVTRLALKPSS
jgi:hypothetical protein